MKLLQTLLERKKAFKPGDKIQFVGIKDTPSVKNISPPLKPGEKRKGKVIRVKPTGLLIVQWEGRKTKDQAVSPDAVKKI